MTRQPVKLKNIMTREIWYTDDFKVIKEINGEEFLIVSKVPNGRTALMKKNIFEKVKQNQLA
jgi:hypothetical protein